MAAGKAGQHGSSLGRGSGPETPCARCRRIIQGALVGGEPTARAHRIAPPHPGEASASARASPTVDDAGCTTRTTVPAMKSCRDRLFLFNASTRSSPQYQAWLVISYA